MSDNEITLVETTKLNNLSNQIQEISDKLSASQKEVEDLETKIYMSDISKKVVFLICTAFFLSFVLISLLMNKEIVLLNLIEALLTTTTLTSVPFISTSYLKKKYKNRIDNLHKIVNEDSTLKKELKNEYDKIKMHILSKSSKRLKVENHSFIKNDYNFKSKKLILEKK